MAFVLWIKFESKILHSMLAFKIEILFVTNNPPLVYPLNFKSFMFRYLITNISTYNRVNNDDSEPVILLMMIISARKLKFIVWSSCSRILAETNVIFVKKNPFSKLTFAYL